MSNEPKKRGRKIKTIDIDKLAEAGTVMEDVSEPFFITCVICGSTRKVTSFKQKHVCIRCIEFIRGRTQFLKEHEQQEENPEAGFVCR